MLRLLPIALLALLLPGCPSKPSHPPAAGADCPNVCQHLRDMSCPWITTPAGVACEDWLCTSHGVKLECLAKSTSCEQASKYQVSGCP